MFADRLDAACSFTQAVRFAVMASLVGYTDQARPHVR